MLIYCEYFKVGIATIVSIFLQSMVTTEMKTHAHYYALMRCGVVSMKFFNIKICRTNVS